MGTQKHSEHMPKDQHRILKEAGKLTGALDKPFEQYAAMDEHELSLAFDAHLLDADKGLSAPKIDIDHPPEQDNGSDVAETGEVGIKATFGKNKRKK